MSIRYEIRAATLADRDELLELAKHLDSVNLPHDEKIISEILEQSEQSFTGEIGDPRRRSYVFVLRDLVTGRAVGTSMVIAQLGRRDAPYIYYDVHVEERYSVTLDKHFAHRVLTIGYSYNGPTEIGGLVVDPASRRSSDRLGMMISYVRFLWIAIHRELFQDRVLAELLPPLEPDGTSHLWEALGRHFTDLSYRDADRLSKRNKEFIRGLFPDGDIYVSVLPASAREVVGQVGTQSKGVEKLLRRIGFQYWDRVDPFDGGPHFVAQTDQISLVQRTRNISFASTGDVDESDRLALLAVESETAPYFKAVRARVREVPGGLCTSEATAIHLGLVAGASVHLLELQ